MICGGLWSFAVVCLIVIVIPKKIRPFRDRPQGGAPHREGAKVRVKTKTSTSNMKICCRFSIPSHSSNRTPGVVGVPLGLAPTLLWLVPLKPWGWDADSPICPILGIAIPPLSVVQDGAP